MLGEVIETSWTAGSATRSRQSWVARAKPKRLRARSAAGALTSATTARRGRSLGSKSGVTAVKASAWHSPMNPVPITPTPISPIARSLTRRSRVSSRELRRGGMPALAQRRARG